MSTKFFASDVGLLMFESAGLRDKYFNDHYKAIKLKAYEALLRNKKLNSTHTYPIIKY